ncbi:hypothetical protein DPV78_001908 [Talaromyces pinophilus]|nr:hypothetical protein DPV78_001908 [Talaromyces pinophilus]
MTGIVKMTSWSTVTETFGLKTSDIVFTVGSTVHIDAPADIFFSIITDVSNYQSWDSWCPKFHFPDGEPVTVGSSGMMQVEIKAQNRTYEIPATIFEMSSSPSTFWPGAEGSCRDGWQYLSVSKNSL